MAKRVEVKSEAAAETAPTTEVAVKAEGALVVEGEAAETVGSPPKRQIINKK